MDNMKTIRVVAAVIRQGDRIFATARGYGEFEGQWEFPGGKIEAGETPQQALIREIKEELDVMVSVGDLIDTSQNIFLIPSIRRLYSHCRKRVLIVSLTRQLRKESFKIVVETKMSDWFHEDQLLRHLNSFTDEKYKVMITLAP